MKGTWIPRHLSVIMTPHEAQIFEHLLQSVVNDEGFPLNEAEDELVEKLLDACRDHGEGGVPALPTG